MTIIAGRHFGRQHPALRNSGIWCFIDFFRVPFRDREPTSAGFVYAKRGLKQRLTGSSPPETDYAQKPETQTIPSHALVRVLTAESDIPINWNYSANSISQQSIFSPSNSSCFGSGLMILNPAFSYALIALLLSWCGSRRTR